MGNVLINIIAANTGSAHVPGGTDFAGTVLTHRFTAGEMPEWRGFNGFGSPEGNFDKQHNWLYI